MSSNYDILNQTLDVVERYIKTLDGFDCLYQHDTCPQIISSLSDIARSPSCLNQINELDDIVDKRYPLSGYHICELRHATEIVKDTLMLLSRGNWDPYNPDGTGDSSITYMRVANALDEIRREMSSWKFTYDNLSASLLHDVLSAIGDLGGMAHKEQGDYAVVGHNHDKIYSRLTFTPTVDYTGQETNSIGGISISTDYLPSGRHYDNINDNPRYKQTAVENYELKMPKHAGNLPSKPVMGALRFIGSQTMANIVSKYGIVVTSNGLQVNPYDSDNKIRADYDGWVFPNGIEIDNINNQLSAAADFFGVSGKIIPPDLNGFFKADPKIINISNPNFSQNAYQLGLKQHSHSINIDGSVADITITPVTEISTAAFVGSGYETGTYNGKPVTTTHGGNKESDEHQKFTAQEQYSLPFDLNVNQTMASAGTNEEPYPKHNIVPVMIYIGGELDSFYYPKE